MRGTLYRRILVSARDRFIPARAGNARQSPNYRTPRPVHPRACGERTPTRSRGWPSRGSSPRVRGTRQHRRRIANHSRFIPARAGNARAGLVRRGKWAVHPRACGERALTRTSRKSESGSSPRVRGTPLPCCVSSSRCAVHPRACGERRVLHQFPRHDAGSSPRVRGTQNGI